MYISGTIEKSHKKAYNFVKSKCDSSRNSQYAIIIIIARVSNDNHYKDFFTSRVTAFNNLINTRTRFREQREGGSIW